MGESYGYLIDLTGVELAEDGVTWIQAFPYGKFYHPTYGEIEFTPERASRMASQVNAGVRGQDLDIDYDHKEQSGEAAGWVKSADARGDGLYLAVEWTKKALSLIKDRAYRYFSPEFADEWEDPKTRTKFKDVLFGGGLTNRPFLKGILPINLSEMTGGNVDPKKMRQLLGLKEDATEDEVNAALETRLATPPPPDPAEQPNPPTQPQPQPAPTPTVEDEKVPVTAAETEEVKQLRERVALLETANHMAAVDAKLAEISQGKKFALAPAARDKVRALALSAKPDDSKKFMELLGEVVNSGLVELGELGATRTTATSATTLSEKVQKKLSENKDLSYVQAAELVMGENPSLYDEYRKEVYVREDS